MSGISKRVSGSWVSGDYGIMKTATDTITTLPAVLYPTGSTATVGLKGQTVQSGTPSPDNPIPPQECGDLETTGEHAGQYKITISSANTTTPVYLGEMETTRRIKKLVLTGEENITQHSVKNGIVGVRIPTSANVKGASEVICTHCNGDTWTAYNGNNRPYSIIVSNPVDGNAVLYMTAPDSDHNTLETFIQWVTNQYNNGTPIEIWYVQQTETTGILNEPLQKIGNYADEVSNISIPVTAGGDTISVDTTLQPSEVTVNYKGWHPVQNVHERDNGAWD